MLIGRPIREPLQEVDRTKKRIKQEINRYTPETAVIFDMDFGHTDPKLPSQLGAKIELDRITEKICFK